MAGHSGKQSRKQEQLICALLERGTIASAAESVGISARTARRWLADPAFLKSYRTARRRLVEHAVGRLQRSMEFAVTDLLKLIREGGEASRLGADKVVLEYGLKGGDTDIIERLEALEARLQPPGPAVTTNGVHHR
jgi:hypothetical protein